MPLRIRQCAHRRAHGFAQSELTASLLLRGWRLRARVEGEPQVAASLERDHPPRGERDRFAALRVPTGPRALVDEGEVTEADDLDDLAAGGGLL